MRTVTIITYAACSNYLSIYFATTALQAKSVEDSGVQANYLAIAPGKQMVLKNCDLYIPCLNSVPGFLRGVEVCGETVLEVVGDKSQKLEWPGYGFNTEVPDGALTPGVIASVAVKAILAGQFRFPEDSQLISAIYWISGS